MKKCWIYALVFFSSFAAQAFGGQHYTAVYIFGDSYCDTGNIWLATSHTEPPPPYYEGRFSDGPIWVEQVAAQFQLPVEPWLGGGTNYAIGGSQLLQSTIIPSIPEEVEEYLYLHGGHADPDALYIIEGGVNDVLFATTTDTAQLGYAIALELAALELQLHDAGATHFLVVNLPDVGILPGEKGNTQFASAVSVSANLALGDIVPFQEFLQGIQINVLNTFGFSHEVQSDPKEYGFTNILTPCLTGDDSECAHPAQTFFWDGYHLTSAAHSVLANIAEEQIHP